MLKTQNCASTIITKQLDVQTPFFISVNTIFKTQIKSILSCLDLRNQIFCDDQNLNI